LNFSEALEELKKGNKIKRKNWGGYWAMQRVVGMGSQTTNLPSWNGDFIVAKLANYAGFAPAQPYQADLLADDWEVIE
jgi:hypothetical protein